MGFIYVDDSVWVRWGLLLERGMFEDVTCAGIRVSQGRLDA